MVIVTIFYEAEIVVNFRWLITHHKLAPKRHGGQQSIKPHAVPVTPLQHHQALCHMKTHFPTHDDLKTLPAFDLTLDSPWNPGNKFDEETMVAPADIHDIYQFATKSTMLCDDAELQDHVMADTKAQNNDSHASWTARINQLASKVKNVDWKHLTPCFAWQPPFVIQKTLENTTQHHRTTSSQIPMGYFKIRKPALRATGLAEKVSTDFIDSSIPSINGGQTGAQTFFGSDCHMITVFGVQSKSEFPEVLIDFLIKRGAPHTLMSKSANKEASAEVKQICRKFQMKTRCFEPYKQHPNRVEGEIQTLKRDFINGQTEQALQTIRGCIV